MTKTNQFGFCEIHLFSLGGQLCTITAPFISKCQLLLLSVLSCVREWSALSTLKAAREERFSTFGSMNVCLESQQRLALELAHDYSFM